MTYETEIFDQMQLLYDATGFNDHQVHCVIRFGSRLSEGALQKALALSLESIPILATRYLEKSGNAVWESLPESELGRAFVGTEDNAVFELETTGRIREETGPQVRVCHLNGTRSALSITMNHMIADGAGFKEYLYYLGETYSCLLRNPEYIPPRVAGDRGMRRVTRVFRVREKIGALIAQRAESNRTGNAAFPFDDGPGASPFIATRVIPSGRVANLKIYCKERRATLNDAFLAVYYRVLVQHIPLEAGEGLEVPIMIDMRRYLNDRRFDALCNLASTTATRLKVREGESFDETLLKAKAFMDGRKENRFGIGGFVKMSLLCSLCGRRLALDLMRHRLRSPLICMTNIGELDSKRLVFADTRIESAFECGSIKYKPHFQVALSGFDGSITLSSNLYGNEKDRVIIDAFLREMEEELP